MWMPTLRVPTIPSALVTADLTTTTRSCPHQRFHAARIADGHEASGCLILLRLAHLGVTNALAMLRLLSMSDHATEAEILTLRHQVMVLERQLHGQKVRFTPADRAFLATLLHRLPRTVLRQIRLLVRPETAQQALRGRGLSNPGANAFWYSVPPRFPLAPRARSSTAHFPSAPRTQSASAAAQAWSGRSACPPAAARTADRLRPRRYRWGDRRPSRLTDP